MNKKTECPECGKLSVSTETHNHVERVGKHTVEDNTDSVPTCSECGNYWIEHSKLERYELRAALTVLLKTLDPNSPEAKYATKALAP